jgi:hypothetical protein
MLLVHPRRHWGRWWLLPGGVPVAYACVVALAGHPSVVLTLLALGACLLAYASEGSKRLYLFLLPCLLVAFGYDAQRYPRAWFVRPERVLVCRLRDWDLTLFRAGPDTTWPDWFAVHHTPVLDLICALPYFAFIYVLIAYALFLYVVDRPRSRWLLWTFAVGNLIAFVCWTVIPAAPPWYVRTQGCLADLCAAPSAAALIRVDALLNVQYFRHFYAHSACVFGSLPSMHCSYPVMGAVVGWRRGTWVTRPLHVLYVAIMAFAAVYLGHHWVIDALAGWIVAIASAALAHRLIGHFATDRSSAPTTPDQVVE